MIQFDINTTITACKTASVQLIKPLLLIWVKRITRISGLVTLPNKCRLTYYIDLFYIWLLEYCLILSMLFCILLLLYFSYESCIIQVLQRLVELSGNCIREWCRPNDDYSVMCIWCKITISCANQGKAQVLLHAVGARHKRWLSVKLALAKVGFTCLHWRQYHYMSFIHHKGRNAMQWE